MAGSMTGLVDARYARPVAEGLLTCGAFTVDLRMPRERWFRWKSGIVAPFGCDCRRLNAFPAVRLLIDGALTEAVRQAFPDAVAGVQSIANWDFPEMRASLDEWRVRALTSYPHILDCARAGG